MSSSSDADESASNNTYFLDPESPTELARLINLDRVTTQAMGGPLSGLTEQEIAGLRNVLDLGCGPGGWVLDVAFEHPEIEVAGVDISRPMIDYANARARSQELTNASFGVMDIRQPLDFADGAFDLVNARLLVAVLLREDWASLLLECKRLLRPGGIVRLTEMVDPGASTSQAFDRIIFLTAQAFARRGYGYSPSGNTVDMTPVMPTLLRRAGFTDVRAQAHLLEFSAGTPGWADFFRNSEVWTAQVQPFLVNMGVVKAEEFRLLHQQMVAEMQQPAFCGMWHFVTVRGTRS
jgi:SAM-dependent methyltransferase